jgi:hypothetical protein
MCASPSLPAPSPGLPTQIRYHSEFQLGKNRTQRRCFASIPSLEREG